MSQSELNNLLEILEVLVTWQAEAENPQQSAQIGYLH